MVLELELRHQVLGFNDGSGEEFTPAIEATVWTKSDLVWLKIAKLRERIESESERAGVGL